MRYHEIICESDIPNISPAFIKAVRRRLKTGQHFGDYMSPKQDDALAQAIRMAFQRINTLAGIGTTMTVYREELRPRADVRDPGTLGIYWCWHAGSAKAHYGQEMATEIHKKQNTITVCYEASVASKDIDWVSTVAANLAMVDEKEITIRQNAKVTLLTAFVGSKTIPLRGAAYITDIGQYDNI
jgi:hypothetical protein